MADVPDPLPILEQSIERNQQLASKIQDYEIETKQLRETMGDQANEITELKTKEKKMQELQSLVAQYDKNIGNIMINVLHKYVRYILKMILDMISLTALTLTVFGGPTDRVNDMQKYLYILFATLHCCIVS